MIAIILIVMPPVINDIMLLLMHFASIITRHIHTDIQNNQEIVLYFSYSLSSLISPFNFSSSFSAFSLDVKIIPSSKSLDLNVTVTGKSA